MPRSRAGYLWASRFITPGFVHVGTVAATFGITASSARRRMRTARVPARLRKYRWRWAGRWFTRKLWVLPLSSLETLVVRDIERGVGRRLVLELQRHGQWPPPSFIAARRPTRRIR